MFLFMAGDNLFVICAHRAEKWVLGSEGRERSNLPIMRR